MSRKKLNESEERIQELEDLYILTRDQFLTDFDDLKSAEKAKMLQQLRGMLDDIAKEAGGRVKRQEVSTTFGSRDSSFLELIASVRGNLPEPKPIIDVMPIMAEQVTNGAEGQTEETAGTETAGDQG